MGSNPTPGTTYVRMIIMGVAEVYDILTREGNKVYAVSLPFVNGERSLLKDLDSEELFISPLKWLERTEDIENFNEIKVVGNKSKVKITSYPTYDVIEYSDKRYIGKVITKPWTLRPFFIFSDKLSSNIKIIDMENDILREINIDSDSVLPFESPLCGGVYHDKVIVNTGTKAILYSISDPENIEIIVDVPHTLTEVYGTTARGLAFTVSLSTNLGASSYFVNCYGNVVRVTNSPIDISGALLDKDWLVMVLRSEPLGPLKPLDVIKGTRMILLRVSGYEVNASSIAHRRHVFVESIATLLDINERYVIVRGDMDILIYNRRGKMISEFDIEELPCDVPGECLFHPRYTNKLLFINEMGKVDSLDIADQF